MFNYGATECNCDCVFVCVCVRARSKACSSKLLSKIQPNRTHLNEKKEEHEENEKTSNNNNRIVNESKPQNIELNYNFTCINNQWESVLLSFLIDTNEAKYANTLMTDNNSKTSWKITHKNRIRACVFLSSNSVIRVERIHLVALGLITEIP